MDQCHDPFTLLRLGVVFELVLVHVPWHAAVPSMRTLLLPGVATHATPCPCWGRPRSANWEAPRPKRKAFPGLDGH